MGRRGWGRWGWRWSGDGGEGSGEGVGMGTSQWGWDNVHPCVTLNCVHVRTTVLTVLVNILF